MNTSRSIRVVKRQVQEDKELELDESQVLEERLKQLLTSNKKKLNRPRDVFNNMKEDVPKLRRSVVTRALQTCYCSTPMPTETKRDFFCTENSLNISPISVVSDKLETEPPDDNREQGNKKQNGEKKLSNKDTNVVQVPIIITDSSSEQDIEANKNSKNIESNFTQTKRPYNTRSSDKNKIIKQITQEKENSPNNIVSRKSSNSLPCEDNTQNEERDTPKNLSVGKDMLTSNIRAKKRIQQKDTLSNRKRIDVNSALKNHIASNLSSSNTESNSEGLKPPNCTRKSRTHSRSQSQNELKEHNELNSKQTKSPGLSQSRRNGERVLMQTRSKSPSHNTNDLIHSATNLKSNQSIYHDLQVDISKGKKTQNSLKAGKSEKDMSTIENKISANEINKNNSLGVNDGTNNINLQRSIRVLRRDHEQSLKEISNHITKNESPRVSPRKVTHKNNALNNTVEKLKGLSPRKLSFIQTDEDTEERNNVSFLDTKMKENKKSNAEIKQPMESLSKIPVLRSRSKSKEKPVERNIEISQSTSRQRLHLNENPESTDQENECNSKDNPEQTKNICAPLDSPPKRPPRKKTNQKRRLILGQVPNSNKKKKSVDIISQQIDSEIIIQPSEIIRHESTVTIGNLEKNADSSPKRIRQNGNSPDKLKTSQKKNLMETSSHNLQKNCKNIKVLKNIVISEQTKEVAKLLVGSGTWNVEPLEKQPIPAKGYVEKATSPLVFENEIQTMNLENNIVPCDNTERIFKNNNRVLADYEEDSHFDKTLVEVGISPVKLAGKNINIIKDTAMPEKTVADVGTSPWDFDNIVINRTTSEVDCIKTEKLNKLLNSLKCSKRIYDSPNTPGDRANSDSGFMKVNQAIHKEVQTSAKTLSEYVSSPKKACREIQTSLRSPCRRTPYKRNFSRNVLSQVFEQQTQTTDSLIRTSNTYRRRNKMIERKAMNGNKSDSSTTDQSEILKEVERERDMLFQSLVDEIVPLNFSSSDDEVFNGTLHGNNSHVPWRIDDKLFPQPSSFKLNFIRSAHEIEIEKSRSKVHNTYHSSDSDSEVEQKKLEEKKSEEYNQTNVLGHTRKTKLQRYSRTNCQNNVKEATCAAKLDSLKCTNEKRSSSSSPSSMSDLTLSDSVSKNNRGYQEERQIVQKDGKSPTPSVTELPSQLPDPNFEGKKCTDAQPIETHLNEVVASDEHNKDLYLSPVKTTVTNNRRSLIVVIDKNSDLIINKRNLHENSGNENDNVKGIAKNLEKFNKRTKSRKKSENSKQQKIYESDNEILATPLEDSEIPQQQHPEDVNDKPDSTQNPQSRDVLSDNMEEISTPVKNSKTSSVQQSDNLNFKVPKIQVHKAKKKVTSDSDGGDFCMTVDSMESGIRRSGREKKPLQRRICGLVAATNEREITYYNTFLQPLKDVNTSSRPSTKPRNTVKKNQKEPRNKRTANKKGQSVRKGKKTQVEEESEKSNFAKKISSIDNQITEEQIQLDMPITDEVNNILEVSSHDDNPKLNKGKKRHTTADNTDNTSTKESYLTPKRSRMSNKRSTITSKRNKNLSKDKTNKINDVSSYTLLPENHQNSTNVDVDNNHVPDKYITNDNDVNNYTSDGISQENMNNFATELAIGSNNYNIDSTLHNGSLEENTQADKLLDKDSGLSTMFKTNTTDNSNLRISKLLTGRINKKYKKGDNIHSKISKVLSRSINHSREMEILNEPNMIDSGSLVHTPVTEPTDSEYINLICNKNAISMKYVEKNPNFRRVNDLMVTEVLKNSKDGGGMGYLELPPGSRKPLHIAKKFALFYFVLEGEAFIQVHNKTSRIGKYGNFIIPLGIEYSINNVSKKDPLTLGFVKVTPNVESQ